MGFPSRDLFHQPAPGFEFSGTGSFGDGDFQVFEFGVDLIEGQHVEAGGENRTFDHGGLGAVVTSPRLVALRMSYPAHEAGSLSVFNHAINCQLPMGYARGEASATNCRGGDGRPGFAPRDAAGKYSNVGGMAGAGEGDRAEIVEGAGGRERRDDPMRAVGDQPQWGDVDDAVCRLSGDDGFDDIGHEYSLRKR